MVASSRAIGAHIAFEDEHRGGRVLGSREHSGEDEAPRSEAEPSKTESLGAEPSEAELSEAAPDVAAKVSDDSGAEGKAADAVPRGWVGDLLESAGGLPASGRKVAIGVALSAVYGLAIGMRSGGSELVTSALGIALAPLAVLILAVPALHIVLAVLDVPIEAEELMRGAARGAAATGLALAGLAPAAALFVVTTETAAVAGGLAGLGLLVAGLFGLLHLRKTYAAALRDIPPNRWFTGNLAFLVFAVFSVILALRLWWPTLSSLVTATGGAA